MFDQDARGEPEEDALLKLSRPTVHTEPVAGSAIESAAMAAFCGSLSPEDWLALEALGQRVRNAMLKQTVRIALRWRKRRVRLARLRK